MSSDLISVIMPVYNVEKYVAESIRSVLEQSYGNFELIVVNDCSPDKSMDIVRTFDDPRITIIEHERNKGLAEARNSGVRASRGAFLAFLDSDDVMLKDRLCKQKRFLDANPHVALCGSWIRTMSEDGRIEPYDHRIMIVPDAVNASLLFMNLFTPSTVMLRRTAFPEEGFRHMYAEDYDFFVRVGLKHNLSIMREVLVLYRVHSQSIMRSTSAEKKIRDRSATQDLLFEKLDVAPTVEERSAHQSIAANPGNTTLQEAEFLHGWFVRLIQANAQAGLFPQDAFEKAAAYIWFFVVYRATGEGLGTVRLFLARKLGVRHFPPAGLFVKFVAKSFLRKPFRSGVEK